MKEKDIQKAILDYINSLPECVAENVYCGPYQSGRPDITACIKGSMVRIEVKRPVKSYGLTALQNENMLKWAKAGCRCFVAVSLAQVMGVIPPASAKLRKCVPEIYCRWCMNTECSDSYIAKEGGKTSEKV